MKQKGWYDSLYDLSIKLACMLDSDIENMNMQIEEEKALKQLRRTMVPHARPLPKFDNPFCPQKYALYLP